MIVKNMRRNIYIFIVIISILSTGFVRSLNLKSPEIINILMPAPFAESTENLVETFNKENQGKVKIKITKGPRETESVSDLAISSLLLGNSPFDILLIDVTWLPKYAAANWLTPLDELIKREDWDSLATGAKLGNTYKEKIYRWPFTADMGLLYWRKDLMKTPPKTPAELIAISKKLKENHSVKYGYVWQGRQYEGLSCVFLEVINGFGGNWLSESNDVQLTSKEALNAAKWLRELITSGASPASVTNFSENEALQIFQAGDAAFMRNWPYAWAELQKEESSIKGKVGVTTMVSEKNVQPTSTLGSWGFSILKQSKHKELAYEVINYLTSKDAQKELYLQYGYTPTMQQIYKDNDKELINSANILNELSNALSIAKPRPETPLYAQISDVLQRQLSSILTTDKPIHEALEIANDKTKIILKSAGNI